MSCKKAVGAAENMKEKYGDRLDVKIFTLDSKEAESYQFRSSTNVLFEKELLPLEIAVDKNKLDVFLASKL